MYVGSIVFYNNGELIIGEHPRMSLSGQLPEPPRGPGNWQQVWDVVHLPGLSSTIDISGSSYYNMSGVVILDTKRKPIYVELDVDGVTTGLEYSDTPVSLPSVVNGKGIVAWKKVTQSGESYPGSETVAYLPGHTIIQKTQNTTMLLFRKKWSKKLKSRL